MALDVIDHVKEITEWLLNGGFFRPIRYVEWIYSIIKVIIKNCKLRIWIDFRNLNLTRLKNEYPMLMEDMFINSKN
jgi:hypothetical protein